MTTAVWDLKSNFDDYTASDVFDCMLAEYLLSEGRYPLTQAKAFEVRGVTSLDELKDVQEKLLAQNEKLNSLYRDVEFPLVAVLRAMESRGITVDAEKMKTIGQEIDKEIMTLTVALMDEFGATINLSSPAQVGSMLVAKFGVPLNKTKTGQYATGERDLSQYAPMYPIITKILRYRELTKLKNTYTEPLISKIIEGKIHTTYSQASVITGRLSSSNPNLQNIPASGEIGIKIKSCFTASPGYILVAFDYSQQELRILASIAQEERMIEAFEKGEDIHRRTASQLFNVSYDAVTKEQRYISKTINFGMIYGMGSFGLSQTLQIPVDEAAKCINNFYKNFPGIKKYYDTLMKEGLKNDYVETLMGRRRYVIGDSGKKFIDNATRRELMNFPIQGSAADIVKKAMVNVADLIKDTDIHLLLQIHDELIFEIPENGQLEKHVESICTLLQTIYPLSVPMDVGIKRGTSWGILKS